MVLEDILNQEIAKQIFQNLLKTERLGHAYLFFGLKGVGKAAFAVEFAKLLLCTGAGEDSCGLCASCRQVEGGNHADLAILAPKDEKSSLGIEDVRRMERQVYLSSAGGKRKIFIIDGAENLTMEGANAFLKTLEEPPRGTLFLLVAHRPQDLPETIRSRCQGIPFHPLPLEATSAALQETWGVEEGEARLFAHLSGGSLGNAIRMMEGAEKEWRPLLLRTLAQLKDFDSIALSDTILESVKEGLKGSEFSLERVRKGMRLLFTALLSILRDLYVRGLSGCEDELINVDLKEDFKNCGIHSSARIEDAMDAVLQARKNLDGNVNPEWILRVLLSDIKEYLWT